MWAVEAHPPALLVAEAGADRDLVTAFGATAGEHSSAALGLHTGTETVGLGPVTTVGLKCALGHGTALLLMTRNVCLWQVLSVADPGRSRKGRMPAWAR
jgi:hypothetical protein